MRRRFAGAGASATYRLHVESRAMSARRVTRTLAAAAASTLALAAALALSACSTPPRDTPPPLPPVTPIMIPPPIPPGSAAELAGTVFAWQATELADGRHVAPAAPDRYTLEFGTDGRVRLRADCNRGSAAFVSGTNRALAMSAIGTTKMGCPAGSHDTEFLRELGQVDAYRPVDGGLVLTLKGSAGAMRFGALPPAR